MTRSCSNARAQCLIDEFTEAAALDSGGFSVRHGIAAVLRHIADTEGDAESWYAVPASSLVQLAAALTAPTLLDRAMAGDKQAAMQFLHKAGFTDQHGQWLPQFQPQEEHDD
jgi:hypothetical protein